MTTTLYLVSTTAITEEPKFVGIDRVNSILINGDEIEIDVSTNWEGQKIWMQRRSLPFYLTVFVDGIVLANEIKPRDLQVEVVNNIRSFFSFKDFE